MVSIEMSDMSQNTTKLPFHSQNHFNYKNLNAVNGAPMEWV